MKAKPKRNKKYDPSRWLRDTTNGIERRMDAMPLQENRATTIAIGHHIAFDLLLKAPNSEAWHDVGSALNMCLVLCEQGFPLEHVESVKSAMAGLMRAMKRAETGGSLALDGEAIKEIRFALRLHDEQIENVDRAEFRKAAKEIVRRVNSNDVYADFQEAA
jgi:hypothetical protein